MMNLNLSEGISNNDERTEKSKDISETMIKTGVKRNIGEEVDDLNRLSQGPSEKIDERRKRQCIGKSQDKDGTKLDPESTKKKIEHPTEGLKTAHETKEIEEISPKSVTPSKNGPSEISKIINIEDTAPIQTSVVNPIIEKTITNELKAVWKRGDKGKKGKAATAPNHLIVDTEAACPPQYMQQLIHRNTPHTYQQPSNTQYFAHDQRSPRSPLFAYPPETATRLLPPGQHFSHQQQQQPQTQPQTPRQSYPFQHPPQAQVHPQTYFHPNAHAAYAHRLAAQQKAHAQLSPQMTRIHPIPFLRPNARHAGPYTPISPQQYAHAGLHHPGSSFARRPSHGQAQRSPLARAAIPPTPVSPAQWQRQRQAMLQESPEVALRRLELERAEMQLQASVQLERLRADVVAKRIAVARAQAEGEGRRRTQ